MPLARTYYSRELLQHEGDDVAVLEHGRRRVATERLGYLDHASDNGLPRVQTGLLRPESFPHETAIEHRQCPADVTLRKISAKTTLRQFGRILHSLEQLFLVGVAGFTPVQHRIPISQENVLAPKMFHHGGRDEAGLVVPPPVRAHAWQRVGARGGGARGSLHGGAGARGSLREEEALKRAPFLP